MEGSEIENGGNNYTIKFVGNSKKLLPKTDARKVNP